MNLDWLFERFDRASERPALIWRGQEFSYRWLIDRVSRWKEEFAARDLAHGTIVAVEGDFSPNACALLLALIEHRAIIVPLASGAVPNKQSFLRTAEVQGLFNSKADNSWEFERFEVVPENPLTRALLKDGRPGLVLFSSGSTGESKASLHDFGRLLDKFKVPRNSLRTLTFLLFDHIGGINTLFYVLSNTGTIVATEQRDPDHVCASIQRHRVELLPTSPTFLNLLLLSEAHARYDLSSLKIITYGTEPMMESTLARLHRSFPDVQLTQTYGLSELGILRSKSKSSNSLLVKMGGEGFETKVVDGVLWIRAQSAMLGYLNSPSPFDEDGWFNTGDEVQVEGDYFRILGRRSEIINVGGEKVFPAEVESVIQTMSNIADVTVRGQANPITGQMVVARVTLKEPENLLELRKRMRVFCQEKLKPYKIPAKVVVTTETQHNARFKKMRREESEPRTGTSRIGQGPTSVPDCSLKHHHDAVTR